MVSTKLSFALWAFIVLSASAQVAVKVDGSGALIVPTASVFKSANSIGGGTGTVTSVGVTTANGVSASGGPITTSGNFSFSLGAITPSSVNGLTLTGGTNTFTLTLGTASLTVPAGVAFNANALLNTLANNSSATASFSNVDAVFHRVNGIFITGTAAKQLTLSNSLTLAGTDSTVMTFPTTSATLARTDTTNNFSNDQNFSTNILVVGSITAGATGFSVDGAGNVVAPFFAGDGNAVTNLTPTNITGTTGAGRNLMGIGTPGSTSFVQLSSIGAASTRTIAQTISDLGVISGNKTATGTATTTFTVTFGVTLSGTGYEVQVTPTSLVAAAVFYVTNKTTTTFDVVYLAGLTGSVTFDWLITQ